MPSMERIIEYEQGLVKKMCDKGRITQIFFNRDFERYHLGYLNIRHVRQYHFSLPSCYHSLFLTHSYTHTHFLSFSLSPPTVRPPFSGQMSSCSTMKPNIRSNQISPCHQKYFFSAAAGKRENQKWF